MIIDWNIGGSEYYCLEYLESINATIATGISAAGVRTIAVADEDRVISVSTEN